MSECCAATANTRTSKHACPTCGKQAHWVSTKTLLHHLRFPLNQNLPDAEYYCCTTGDCDTVYFSSGSQGAFSKEDVRDLPWEKVHTDDATICFCFGISQVDISKNTEAANAFIQAQTKAGLCECDARNPTGKCCLADVKKLLKPY